MMTKIFNKYYGTGSDFITAIKTILIEKKMFLRLFIKFSDITSVSSGHCDI
jgi:hypothetical protein